GGDLGKDFVEPLHVPRHSVEAETVKEAREVIGEGLSLGQDRQQCSGPLVDEGLLLEQPGVDMIEEQRGPYRHVDERAALRTQVRLPTEGAHQLLLEGERFTSRRRAAVNR